MHRSRIPVYGNNTVNIKKETNIDSLQTVLSNQTMDKILEDKDKYSAFLITYSREIQNLKFFIAKAFEKLMRKVKIHQSTSQEYNLKSFMDLLEDEKTYEHIFDYEILKSGGLNKIQSFIVNFDIFFNLRSTYQYWNRNMSFNNQYSKYIGSSPSIKQLIEDYSETEIKIIKSLLLPSKKHFLMFLLDGKVILYDNFTKEIISSFQVTDFENENCIFINDITTIIHALKNSLFILNFADKLNIIKQKIDFSSDIIIIYEAKSLTLSIFTESSIQIYSFQKSKIISSLDNLYEPFPCHSDLIQDNFILFYENKYYIKLLSLSDSSCEEYLKCSNLIRRAKLINEHKHLIIILTIDRLEQLEIWDYFKKSLKYTILLYKCHRIYKSDINWKFKYFHEKKIVFFLFIRYRS